MKLSERQANGLKTWTRGEMVDYAAIKAGREIGTKATISSLCLNKLIVRNAGVDAGYQLTARGLEELGRCGFSVTERMVL